jgi:hypothetical protein
MTAFRDMGKEGMVLIAEKARVVLSGLRATEGTRIPSGERTRLAREARADLEEKRRVLLGARAGLGGSREDRDAEAALKSLGRYGDRRPSAARVPAGLMEVDEGQEAS